MHDETATNALVRDRVDRFLSWIATFVASAFLAGAFSMARAVRAVCPGSEACVPAVLATILCSMFAVALGGVLVLFQPRD